MRTLPDPGFAGDDGATPSDVAEALAAYDARPEGLHSATLAVLQHARLLVPVVAVLGATEYDDAPVHDKSSDMATVSMRGRDGRTALLAFTGTDPLRRWDADARPVPVSARTAAEAALQDGAAAVLVDVAGPVMFVVDTDDLAEMARGNVLVPVSDRYGWARPGR